MKRRCVLGVAIAFLIAGSMTFAQGPPTRDLLLYEIRDWPVADCGEFQVLGYYDILYRVTYRFDKFGNMTKEFDKAFLSGGPARYENSLDPSKQVTGIPKEHEIDLWDYENGLFTGRGPTFLITVPGYGRIFAETGRYVIDLNTGDLLFNSGQNQAFDGSVALCDYLR